MASDTPLLEKLQSELRQSQTPSGSENDLSSTEYLNVSDGGGGGGGAAFGSSQAVASTGSQSTSTSSVNLSSSMERMNNMNVLDMSQRLNNVLQPKVLNNLVPNSGQAPSNINMMPLSKGLLKCDHEMLRKLLDLPPPPQYSQVERVQMDKACCPENMRAGQFERRQVNPASISQSISQPDLRRFELVERHDQTCQAHNQHNAHVNSSALHAPAPAPAPPAGASVATASGSGGRRGGGGGEQQALGVAECENIAQKATHMVHVLYKENANLREELDMYYRKVSKLQKLEVEIEKIQKDHEALHKSSERREKLERHARIRLEQEVQAGRQRALELSNQLQSMSSQNESHELSSASSSESELRKELNRRDAMISQLLSESKELQDIKERQEMELSAQRATLAEQRQHIDILDNALTNAQSTVVKLEEEVRKKQMYVDKVEQLQQALSSLQQASDRREVTEKKLRARLEQQVAELKRARNLDMSQDEGHSGTMSGLSPDSETDINKLMQSLSEREEKIMQLESEVTKLEQRYLEESAMKQIAIDAASMPKDAKIEALEKSSIESEKWLAEARTEKLRHMDEIYGLSKKNADLDGRMQLLQTELAEKDAMIRVLQRHTAEKDAAFEAILRSPRHSPHASLHAHSHSLSQAHVISSSPTTTSSSLSPSSTSSVVPSHTHSLSLSQTYGAHSHLATPHTHSHSSLAFDLGSSGYRYAAATRPLSGPDTPTARTRPQDMNHDRNKDSKEVCSRQTWIV